ncbi:DUF6745 domain-containing protein [Lentzea flava]|uniref:DUF6745 domain-containing protein n=1 Tax=Lentzea flava TaxID=103732 RepID=A0ABQ2UY77_9PSEU|nr:hypothetical protein [Lentzea flava]MCP2202220.1 hypothetical protein [Lentzea flava]GGU57976.1 hypothetical protein GCM10010178_57920 [Lentzea flava]
MSAPGGLEARSSRLRDDWFAHALSTAPADRPAAEEAVARLYATTGRPPPEFIWVRSPAEAAEVLPHNQMFRYSDDVRTVEVQIATHVSGLRHRHRGEWQGAASRLRRSVRESLVPAVNSTMPRSPGLGWAGQHDADWLARLDVRCGPADLALLEVWKTLTRSTGWWWPREGVCVMADRPVAVHVDANSLLHNDNGPALAFSDGSHAYAWHGRTVPRWVIEEPDVVRIMTEPDVEVRLCAAEHLGWERYVAEVGPPLIATAPDPGNPGFDLRLYDLWDRVNLLLVVNGSVERDGSRRRYGLNIPRWYRDPVDAAAWTYGLRADQYAQLQRRT